MKSLKAEALELERDARAAMRAAEILPDARRGRRAGTIAHLSMKAMLWP